MDRPETSGTAWTKPELVKLGELKDVAGGVVGGNDVNGHGSGTKSLTS
ncbi:MAG: hypothetical protein KGM49_02960 [Sphingomonadales bacterium]|nr:hypothetical protein [Sphingomonadales bacterium]